MAIRIGLDIGSHTLKTIILREDGSIEPFDVFEIQGQPTRRVCEVLEEIHQRDPNSSEILIGLTGAGSPGVCESLGLEPIDEPNALTIAVDQLYPDIRTVIEMGRQSQKYLLFERDKVSNRLLLVDSNLGNKCAAGSGSFLDHMHKRLNFSSIEEFSRVAFETPNPASLSGRCSVFTESDIVHLYQKGTPRERIAAGIHQAICRNYRSTFARGKTFVEKVAFLGGVASNPAVIKYIGKELDLEGKIFIPEHFRTLGAIGSAMRAVKTINLADAVKILKEQLDKPLKYVSAPPLQMKLSEQLKAQHEEQDIQKDIPLATLGVDIGSVSTKAALITDIDGKFVVLGQYYRRTDGDPLAAVRDTLGKIQSQIQEKGYRIGKIVAATTGSGRYLTGDYIGADLIKNEITAQANGALTFTPEADTVLEIGGQDSKFIRLDGSVITDFEMNKACAAGTGAFLEKQAERVGVAIQDFGDIALKGTRPPDLDSNCTVFTESAAVYYQQNNVPIEDLCASICLASAKNYLNKNVGTHQIGNHVVFQGAVAFNKGMVAAFETLLKRKIVVPPHPDITGAIGAARLAYRANVPKSHFRGFDKIAEGKYTVDSFECKGCPNRCDVNTFQMEDGPKYFYNDRCEKFSALQKKNLGENLPNLFAEREDCLMNVYSETAPTGAPRIGIPRGMMFNEYYPLYKAFFTELGFEVVPSDKTNKQVVKEGLDVALGEPCFPFKVTHGHFLNVLQKGVDYLFFPAVINTEQPNPNLRQSQTCPYLQGAPEVISAAIGIEKYKVKFLRPRLYFKYGLKYLENAFIQIASEVGKTPSEARRAFQVGIDSLRKFRSWQEKRGREVLNTLDKDQSAIVIVGRPYTLYDETINMDIVKKIQEMGILAIPQDFMPLSKVDITDSWSNAYARQIQKKLAAARIIREDPRLRAVVLTYFGCGPDSFANPFFKDEVGKPCYMMQIDEHTADAGVITRLEAFADTSVEEDHLDNFEIIRTEDRSIMDLEDRKLWIPNVNGSARVLAAVLTAYGINSDVVPRSPDPGLNHARAAISEDVCLPCFMTTEDILVRAEQPDFNPDKEAFFMGNAEGPCRFGMYSMMQRRILDKIGLKQVDVATLGAKSHHGGLGETFALAAWDGLVAHDVIFKMLLRVRPYEINSGQSDRLFNSYVQKICDMMPERRRTLESKGGKWKGILGLHIGPMLDLVKDAREDFSKIPVRKESRPLVGVVGEFYVRLHNGANQDVLRKVEEAGGEAWLAPLTEFFSYSVIIGSIISMDHWRDLHNRISLRNGILEDLLYRLAERDDASLFKAARPFLNGYEDISAKEVIQEGEIYVNHAFGGEAICSMGKSEDFAKRGLDGIISVIPFNCMPGNMVSSLSYTLRKRHNNIPFLNLDFDGYLDSTRKARLNSFMWQVKERFACDGDEKSRELVTASH